MTQRTREHDVAPAEHPVPGDDLATRLSDVAQALQQQPDVPDTLESIVQAAADAVPGAEHVSISAIESRRHVETLASTSGLARAVDEAQYETGQGPCLDTLYEQHTARIRDLGEEERWPVFADRARGLGLGSMLAVQLYVRGQDLGALNLSSSAVDAFDGGSEHVALLFASHAAIAMAGAQEAEHLRAAITFRDLIGQAKGILMERYKLTGDQAFQALTQVSQNTNRKLRDVARQLTEEGTVNRGGRGGHRTL